MNHGPFRGQRLHMWRPWPRAAGAEGKNPREVRLDQKGSVWNVKRQFWFFTWGLLNPIERALLDWVIDYLEIVLGKQEEGRVNKM